MRATGWRATIGSVLAAAVLAAAVLAAGPTRAEPPGEITLSIPEARQMAADALVRGQFALALQLAEALLSRDPQDYPALIQATTALIGLGRLEEAAGMARRAFRAARTAQQRVGAARLAASARFRAGQHLRAEFWLRRAFNSAGDAQSREILRREFATVRQENPFTASIGFSLAPNDNVNNGSSAETILIWNLPFVLSADARALSGIEAATSIGMKYRLSRNERQQTHLALSLYGRSYRLSPEARAAAPTVKGSDYAFAMAELSLLHERRIAALPGPSSAAVTAGRYWYGGAPYLDYQRLTLGQGFELGERLGARLSLGIERQVSILAGGAQSYVASLSGGLTLALAGGGSIDVELLASETASQDITNVNQALRGQITWSPGRPVLGGQLSLTLSAEKRDYPFSIYDAAGRHDLTVSGALNLTFSNIALYGFSPAIGFETSRTESNIGLYDRRSSGLRLGLRSTF